MTTVRVMPGNVAKTKKDKGMGGTCSGTAGLECCPGEGMEGHLSELCALPGRGARVGQVERREVMARGFSEMLTIQISGKAQMR